jgi:tRNA pseudouridine32 synthase/23S rRNA pseudouridine746 synthase/23S rRNA pseudouridine1911/1915/1917 synthase
MLFARTEAARDQLKDMFEKHDLERTYIGIVEGVLDAEKEGTWSAYVYEDGNYVVHATTDPSRGALAVTHYTIERSDMRSTWLRMELETGRKNQIRVHCQLAGHPIVGDRKYGAKTNPIKRLCLHAHSLAFKHPITQKPMRFISPIPQAFYRVMAPVRSLKGVSKRSLDSKKT